MRKRSQAIIAAMLALGMAVGMCGCEGQLPTPKATTRQDAPNLSAKQEQKVRTRILKTLDQCNQNRDTDTLPTILEGPELDIRTSELNVAKATGNLDRKTTIPTDLAQAVISTDAGWPRSVFSITSTTKDQQSKRLLVFRQDSARQNYKLWGVARLFSGVKMPSFEISKTGSAQGTPTDTGLVMTPKAAVDAYADLLQNGANSKYASKFADDDLRSKLADLTAQVQKAMELNEGTQQQTFEPVNGAISVMRSADGGDLVVAQINSEWTRSAGAGRESQPASDAEKALFGKGHQHHEDELCERHRAVCSAGEFRAENHRGRFRTPAGEGRSAVKRRVLGRASSAVFRLSRIRGNENREIVVGTYSWCQQRFRVFGGKYGRAASVPSGCFIGGSR